MQLSSILSCFLMQGWGLYQHHCGYSVEQQGFTSRIQGKKFAVHWLFRGVVQEIIVVVCNTCSKCLSGLLIWLPIFCRYLVDKRNILL